GLGTRRPRRFRCPDRPISILAYIRRLLRDVRTRHHREEVLSDDIDKLCARIIKAPKRIPSRRGLLDDGWLPVPDVGRALGVDSTTIYRWGRQQKVTLEHRGKQAGMMPEEVERAREIVTSKNVRAAIMAALVARGLTLAAAKKKIYRHLKAGMTLKEIGE